MNVSISRTQRSKYAARSIGAIASVSSMARASSASAGEVTTPDCNNTSAADAGCLEGNRDDHEKLHGVEDTVCDHAGNQVFRPVEREADDERDDADADQQK